MVGAPKAAYTLELRLHLACLKWDAVAGLH